MPTYALRGRGNGVDRSFSDLDPGGNIGEDAIVGRVDHSPQNAKRSAALAILRCPLPCHFNSEPADRHQARQVWQDEALL